MTTKKSTRRKRFFSQKNILKLTYFAGFDFPEPKDGTWIFLDVKDEYDKFQKSHYWRVYLLSTSYRTINLEVTPPTSCIVNEWVMSIYTQTLVGMPKKPILRYEHPLDIVILFNPWCKSTIFSCTYNYIIRDHPFNLLTEMFS